MRRGPGALAAVVIVLVATGCSSSSASRSSSSAAGGTTVSTTPGPPPSLRTTAPPWPAPATNVSAYVTQAGLPLLPSEGLVEHIHAHLDVTYDGQRVEVPARIGIDEAAARISPLHTHDSSGIVHIESTTVAPFYLGQFFTEWGVSMSATCVAERCTPAQPVAVYVNGTRVDAPFDKVELKAHAEVLVAVGAPPATIPTTYSFPQGY